MSTFIVPVERRDRKGKILFCFNPYPLSPIKSSIAVDGYLTSLDKEKILKGWGKVVLKKCFQDKDRNIIEDGAVWPFFGYYSKKEKDRMNLVPSMYDFLMALR